MTPVDAALSALFAGNLVAAIVCARRRPGFAPTAAALAALLALHCLRLAATPVLDDALPAEYRTREVIAAIEAGTAEPYVFVALARWALRCEIVALAWWPWVTACLAVATVGGWVTTAASPPAAPSSPGAPTFTPSVTASPRASRSAPAAAAHTLDAATSTPGATKPTSTSSTPTPTSLRSALLLAAAALAASCALAAAYPRAQGAALLSWYPRARVAALAVVAGVVWRRLRVERVSGADEVHAGIHGAADARTIERGERSGGVPVGGGGSEAEHEGGERLHPPSVALRSEEVPALVLAAEQAAQLVLWSVGPWRIVEAWPAVEAVSCAGYGALLCALVGIAVRRP